MLRTPTGPERPKPVAYGPQSYTTPRNAKRNSTTPQSSGRVTSRIPLEERFYPAKLLLDKYPDLRYERWLPGLPHSVSKNGAGAIIDTQILRGPNNYPLCLWCGEETQSVGEMYCTPSRWDGGKAVCNAGCYHEHRLRKCGTYVRGQLSARDQGKCDECGINTFELYSQAVACSTLSERKAMFKTLANTISPEWMAKVRRPLASLDMKFNEGMFWEAAHIIDVNAGGGLCGLDGFRTLCVPCHAVETSMRNRFKQRLTPNHCHTCGAYSPAQKSSHSRHQANRWSAPRLNLNPVRIHETSSHESVESTDSLESLDELLGPTAKQKQAHNKLQEFRDRIGMYTYVANSQTPTTKSTANDSRQSRLALLSIHNDAHDKLSGAVDLTELSPTSSTYSEGAPDAAAGAEPAESGSAADLDILASEFTSISISLPREPTAGNDDDGVAVMAIDTRAQAPQPADVSSLVRQLNNCDISCSSKQCGPCDNSNDSVDTRAIEPEKAHLSATTSSNSSGSSTSSFSKPAGLVHPRSCSSDIRGLVWTSKETLAIVNGFRRFGSDCSAIKDAYQSELSVRSVEQISSRIKVMQSNNVL